MEGQIRWQDGLGDPAAQGAVVREGQAEVLAGGVDARQLGLEGYQFSWGVLSGASSLG